MRLSWIHGELVSKPRAKVQFPVLKAKINEQTKGQRDSFVQKVTEPRFEAKVIEKFLHLR